MITVISPEDGSRVFVGTGFVIARSAASVVCVTASHVIEEAVERALHYNFPVRSLDTRLRRQATRKAWESGRICIGFGAPDRHCPLDNFSWETTNDLGLLGVTLPEEMHKGRRALFLINSDIPPRGPCIVAMGLELVGGEGREGNVMGANTSVGFKAIAGRIAEIVPSSRLVRVTTYKTGIPVTGGMSGGPVVLLPTDEDPREDIVIGVISNDVSIPEAFSDPRIAGDSSVMPVAYAYVPELPGETDNDSAGLSWFRANGAVEDVGRNADRLRVTHVPDDSSPSGTSWHLYWDDP
jgi:hypothetical protein